ncbi:MAG: hypothetical protein JHC26_09930 [Thermofilum sp.]|jgi:hypothetical protein|uniref:hypothetical protein n=1 Tax=Thermofilum sp. TaxID=1961369 RepID=UPI002584E8DC|nr:hypothetical protein [Thermofilum sp.]MCI4409401.1 hypothetical protein [Thermofilum sp.]
MTEKIDTQKYEQLENLARDLYDVYNERSRNKYNKILNMIAEIKSVAEKLIIDAKAQLEQEALQAIIEDCNAIEEILKQQKKNRKTRELLEIHVEDIVIQAKLLRGKAGDVDPGYDPTENFISDAPDYEPPSLLEDFGDFYDV